MNIKKATILDYHRIAVKVFCNNKQIGSGSLLWSRNEECLYCITAAHCVEKNNIIQSITLVTKDEFENDYNCNFIDQPIIDSKDDIAIFKVEINETTKAIPKTDITSVQANFSRYTINAFPEECEGDRNVIFGEYNTHIGNEVKLNLSHLQLGEKFQYEQLVGISGGGCYIESGRNIAFWGVEISVPKTSVPFNEVNCIRVETINNILRSKDMYLLENPTAHYIFERQGNYSIVDEELSNGYYENKWVETKFSEVIKEKIEEHFLENNFNKVLYIYGMSGLGKTRAALMACYKNDVLKNVIYYNSYDYFSEDIRTLKKYVTDYKAKLYIIIDDVCFDDWQDINNRFSRVANEIRIICIGVIPKKQYFNNIEGTVNINSNDLDIKKVIRSSNSGLNENEIQYIFDQSSCDLRLAILLANIIKKDKELIYNNGKISFPISKIADQYNSVDKILRRTIELYFGKINKDILLYFIRLSLFIDIGYTGENENELEFFIEKFELSKYDCLDVINDLTQVKLGIKKGNYFEISPRALARQAFEESGWKIIRKDFYDFYESIPTYILKQRFMQRVIECENIVEKEVKEAYASWFRIKYSKYSLSKLNDNDNAREFRLFAEYCPEVAIKWIKNNVLKLSQNEILYLFDFHYKGRREIVWMCDHLANFEEFFFDCEEILFHLAQSETEKGISNNSQGIWSALFSIDTSNTCVSFFERFDLLMRRLLLCDDMTIGLLFEKAFNIVLSDSDYKVRVLPPKLVGGRITPNNWFPKTYDELIKCKEYILDLIVKSIDKLHGDSKVMIINVIINNIRSYVRYNMLNEYKDRVQKILENQEQKNKLILVIDSEIGFLEYHKKENFAATSICINSLLDWKNELSDKTLIGKIVEYLSRETWSHGHSDEQIQNRNYLVNSLCNELYLANGNINILQEILGMDNLRLSALNEFGEILATVDVDNIFREAISQMIFKNNIISFVKGYYVGNSKKNNGLQKFYLELIDKCVGKNPQFSLWASIIFDINESGYNRIIKIVGNYEGVDELLNIKYLDWSKILSEQQKIKLLSIILEHNNYYKYYLLFEIAEAWIIQDKKLGESYFDFIINFLEKYFSEVKKIEEYRVVNILKLIPNNYISKIIKIVAPALDFNEFNYELLQYVSGLAQKGYTRMIINDVGERLLECYNSCVRGPAKKGYFNDFDLEVLKEWINEDPKDRAKAIAYHLSSPNLEEYYIDPLTEYILTEFEDDENVFYSFKNGRYNFVAYSLDDEFKNKDVFYKKIEKYRNSNLKRIKEWAEMEFERMKRLTEEYIAIKNEDKRYIN